MNPLAKMRHSLRLGTALATGLVVVLHVPAAQAAPPLPTGQVVVSGAPSFDASVANTLKVDLHTANAVINWTTFNVASGNTVQFVSTPLGHPGTFDTGSVAVLNRVGYGGSFTPSVIAGAIDAGNGGNNNIAVWLVNPGGITFGPGGTYSGGSLVLSTLDAPNALATTEFKAHVLGGGESYDAAATKAIGLFGGAGPNAVSLVASGNVLLIGQQITVGDSTAGDSTTVRATGGSVAMVAASDVTFTAGLGSPLSFTINAGATVTGGIHVLGTGMVNGQSVTIAAMSTAAGGVPTLLQADSGSLIEATDTNGVVTLATKSVTTGSNALVIAGNGDGIVANGGSGATAGLKADGTGGAIKLAAAGNIALASRVDASAGTAMLSVDGAAIALSGADYVTAGNQTFTGPVTLAGDTTLTTGGTAKFTATVDGASLLTVAQSGGAGGAAEFDGVVGSTPLAGLSVAGASTIKAASITTTGAQAYTAAVTLGVPTVTLSATGAGAPITLGAVSGAGDTLVVGTNGGSKTFHGVAAATLTLNGTGTKILDDGTYDIANPVAWGAVTTNGTLLFKQDTIFGATTLGTDTTLDSSAANTAITLGLVTGANHNLAVSTGGGAQSFSGMSQVAALTLSGTGTRTLNAGTYDIATIPSFGNVTTTGGTITLTHSADFGAVTLGASTVFDGSAGNQRIRFFNTVSDGGSGYDLSVLTGTNAVQFRNGLTAHSLTLSPGAAVLLQGGTYDLATPFAWSAYSVDLTGSNVFKQNATFGAITVDFGAASIGTLGANLTFNQAISGSGADLSLNAGAGTLQLAGITANSLTLAGTGTRILNTGTYALGGATDFGAVTTNGTLTLGQDTTFGATTLGTATTLDSSVAGKAITLGPVTGGGNPLAVNTGVGAQTFNGFGGVSTLTLTGTGTRTLNAGTYDITTAPASWGAVTLGGGTLTFKQAASFGNVLLGGSGDTTLATAPGVTFTGTVDGSHGLAIAKDGGVGGGAIFDKDVGVGTALNSLAVAGTATLGDPPITIVTSGDQNYAGAVTLAGDTTLTVGGKATFGATVDGSFALSIDKNAGAGGNAEFDGNVGGGVGTALTSLAVAGTTTVGKAPGPTIGVTTSGNQTYSATVTLGATGTLTSTAGTVSLVDVAGGGFGLTLNGHDVAVTGAVDNVSALQIVAADTATDTGGIGATIAPASLSVTGKTISLGAAGVTQKAGTITANSNVANGTITLASGATLEATGGDLVLEGTASGTTITGTATSLLKTDAGSGGSVLVSTLAGGIANLASNVSSDNQYTVKAGTITLGGTTQTAKNLVSFDTTGLVGGTDVTSNAGLTITSTTNDVQVTATGNANLSANVLAGRNYTVSAKAVNLAVGAAGTVTQSAAGIVDITATNGDITGGANLRLTSNSGGASAANYLVLDAGATGTITLAAGSRLTASAPDIVHPGKLSPTLSAPVGLIYGVGKDVQLGDVSALQLGNASGLPLARGVDYRIGATLSPEPARFTAGMVLVSNAIDILASDTITLGSATSETSSINLNNVVGGIGDIVVGKLDAFTYLDIEAGHDVLIATYDPVHDTGYVTAETGTATVKAGHSVGTVAAFTASGIGSISAPGNLTVIDPGDLRVNALTASGSLALNIGGALTGTGGTTPTVTGGAIFSHAGGVTVIAGQTTSGDVIALDTIGANGPISLTADTVAVNTTTFYNTLGALNLAAPGGGLPAAHYVGLIGFTGSGDRSLTLNDGIGFTSLVAHENVASGPVYNAEIFNPNYGAVDLTAQAGDITGSVGGAAQLGTVTASGSVGGSGTAFSTGGIVAGSVTATNGLVNIAATGGTLSLLGVDAHTTLTLAKSGGSAATEGDDLRVVTGTSGGAASLTSSTAIRVGNLTASTGALTLTANGGDITGLLQVGKLAGAPFPAVGDVTTTTTFTDNYALGFLKATSGDLAVTAANGVVQLSSLIGATVTASAKGLAIGSAGSGGTLALTATDGTLYLGSGSAHSDATLTKLGGSVANAGDEVRVNALGTFGKITIDSQTSVRVGQENVPLAVFAGLLGQGDVKVTARTGDVSGFLSSGQVDGRLAQTSLTGALDPTYGKGTIRTANAGSVTIMALNGAVQLADLSSAADYTVTALAISGDKAGTADFRTIAGTLNLDATAGTLSLASATANFVQLVKDTGSVGIPGDELRVGAVTGTTGIVLSSATDVRVDSAIATVSGDVAITAVNGDVTGQLQPAGSWQNSIGNVTTGTRFSADYGLAFVQSSAGNATVNAAGSAQLSELSAAYDITHTASAHAGGGLTVQDASGGQMLLTADAGTLYLGSGQAHYSAFLTKNGTGLADGNDLRVLSFTGVGNLLSIRSQTSVRIGRFADGNGVSVAGDVNVTASDSVAGPGDISGFGTGVLSTVSPGSLLSPTLGAADIKTTFGSIALNAAHGGVQAGTLSAGNGVTSTSLAFSGNTITSGTDTVIGATNGTLVVDTVNATGGAQLTKAGTPGGTGDELSVLTGLTAGVPVGVGVQDLISSSTSARIKSAVTTGAPLTVIAAQDVTGLAVGSPVATNSDPNFDRAVLSGDTGLTVTAGGLVQGGVWSAANGALAVTAGDATHDGSIDLLSLSALGDVTLKATAITPLPLVGTAAYDGDILVGGTITGANTLIDNTVNGGNSGNVLVGDNVTANGNYTINAVGNITLGNTATAVAQMAKGAVAITSMAGNIAQGTMPLVLTANSDVTGAEALTITASSTAAGTGNVWLGGTDLVGGSVAGHQSAVAITANKGATFGTINGASLVVRAGGDINATGNIAAGNATLAADAVAGPATIDLATTSGGITMVNATTTGAGHGITLAAAGDITGQSGFTATLANRPSLLATGDGANITVTSGKAVQLNAAIAGTAGGALSVTAGTASTNGAIMIDFARATGALTLDALATQAGGDANHNGAITLGIATADGTISLTNVKRGGTMGDITVGTNLAGGGDVLVDAAGNLQLAVASATKTLALRAGGTVGGIGAGSAVPLTAGEDLAVKAGGAVNIAAASAGDDFTVTTPAALTLASANATGAGADTRSVDFTNATQIGILATESLPGANIALTSTGAGVSVTGSLGAAAGIAVSAAGDAALAGPVTAGGDYTVSAGQNVLLGGLQSANGKVQIASSGGNVGTSSPLTLTANADGVGSEALTITAAQSINLAAADLVGGNGGLQSAIALTTTNGSTAINSASGASLLVTTQAGFTAGAAIATGNAALPADAAGGPATVDITVSNGDLTTTTVTASGAGHDVHLGASGAITTAALTAARGVTIGGNSATTGAASFSAPAATATAGPLTITAGSANVAGAAASGGATTVTTSGASHFGSIGAGGDLTVTAASLGAGVTTAGGAMTITTGGDTHLASASSVGAMTFTAATLEVDGLATSTGSSIGVTTTGATLLGSANAGTDLTITAASLGADVTTASGAMTITTTGGDTHLASASAVGAMTITAGTLEVVGLATSTGSSIGVTTTGATLLGSASAGGAITVTGGNIAVSGTTTGAGLITMTANTGTLSLGNVTNTGDVTLSAKTAATLAGITATGKTVTVGAASATLGGAINAATVNITTSGLTTLGAGGTITATDATLKAADLAIGGTVNATNLSLVDDAAAGNAVLLGDAAGSGFALSAAEINNLSVANLVIDAGTGTGLTPQAITIGNLALTNPVLTTLKIYGVQQITITGALTAQPGSGLLATRNVSAVTPLVQIGGNAATIGDTGAPAGDLASVITIVAKADGSGGSINLGSNAYLELAGQSIGVGQDKGFLANLGLGTPGGTTQTPEFMVSNAGSALYSAQVGGVAYASGQNLIIAGSMKVRYKNFALFQNTGTPGQNQGVVLGVAGDTSGQPRLTIIGPNPPDGGPFGLFGTINGKIGIPTALVGSPTITVIAVNRPTARVNGCLIGSGAGCLSSLALTPTLGNLTQAPTSLIIADTDFLIPFDPLIATNNDSLFGDVGTFGLETIAEPPVECAADSRNPCGTKNEGAPK